MNLLQIVQAFAKRTGIPSPAIVISNTDSQIVQAKALLEEVLDDIVHRWRWTGLTREATHTTLAQEDQGALSDIADEGFHWIYPDSMFNRSTGLPIRGAVTPADWQSMKANNVTGPYTEYRIRQGRLLLIPSPTAGQTIAFSYGSTYAATDSDGTNPKQYPENDTDLLLIDSVMLLAGLRWKWKSEKGLNYAEDFTRYEQLINNAKLRDTQALPINMDSEMPVRQPGVVVPSGSWNL